MKTALLKRLASSAQRLVLAFLLFSVLYSLFSITPVSAQTTNYSTPNVNPDVPKNLHTWTQNVMIEVMSSLACQLAGVDPINPNQACLGIDPASGKIGFVKNGGGAIGLMGSMIGMLYTAPIHTSDYINYLASNFGIVKPSYAQNQGVGFTGLKPVMKLWTIFRNIVYLLFVIVFVVIGLAIMLRIKIDPRTVMTIENQIPKVIVSLVLVTFSFAIAGVLIDLMYVGTFFIINIFTSADPEIANNVGKINSQLNTPALGFVNQTFVRKEDNDLLGAAGGVTAIAKDASGSIGNIVENLFRPEDFKFPTPVQKCKGLEGLLCWVNGNAIGEIVTKTAGDLISTFFAVVIGWVARILGFIIIFIALLWALIRVWFALLRAYVFILIDIVLAPFFLLASVLPGVGIGAWFREIIANLSAFPVTIFILLIGKVFMDEFGALSPGQAPGQIFVPPLIGNPGDMRALGALIGLIMILITPQALTMVRETLKAPEFKYLSAAGQALGVGAGIVNVVSHAQKLSQFSYQSQYLDRTPIIGGLLGRIMRKPQGKPQGGGD